MIDHFPIGGGRSLDLAKPVLNTDEIGLTLSVEITQNLGEPQRHLALLPGLALRR